MADAAELSIEERFQNYIEPPKPEPSIAPAAPAPAALNQGTLPLTPPVAPELQTPEQIATPAPGEEEGRPGEEEPAPEIEVDPSVPFLEITTKGQNGEDVTREWSLDEMRAGVMMQADYQRKTADLARAREQVGQEVQQKVTEQSQKYDHNVRVFYNAFAQLAGQELQNVDWTKLSREDPAQFVALSQRAAQFNHVLTAAQQELEKLNQQNQEQFKQSMQQQTQDAVEVLQRDVRDWGNELYSSILKTGVDAYGFKPEEVGNVTDPRMIKVLIDAHRYRELQQARPEVNKRVSAAPKVVKPGAAPEAADTNSRYTEARKRLSKSHNVDDAARAFFERDRAANRR